MYECAVRRRGNRAEIVWSPGSCSPTHARSESSTILIAEEKPLQGRSGNDSNTRIIFSPGLGTYTRTRRPRARGSVTPHSLVIVRAPLPEACRFNHPTAEVLLTAARRRLSVLSEARDKRSQFDTELKTYRSIRPFSGSKLVSCDAKTTPLTIEPIGRVGIAKKKIEKKVYERLLAKVGAAMITSIAGYGKESTLCAAATRSQNAMPQLSALCMQPRAHSVQLHENRCIVHCYGSFIFIVFEFAGFVEDTSPQRFHSRRRRVRGANGPQDLKGTTSAISNRAKVIGHIVFMQPQKKKKCTNPEFGNKSSQHVRKLHMNRLMSTK
ncbi:hypothetical protein EVAR_76331_1 [Eumeta japonica]|uniref:Uncharacterized protein n=1 Tax=Eumeta variegata TaxID=151549 RepID=A0A4C1TAG7_EUMVA|nr:hypothetical protein EVAR_76331_1 [Eumeta japonica]